MSATRSLRHSVLPDLNLGVKAYVQPLGSENCWTELGDGEFELLEHTIRVCRSPSNGQHGPELLFEDGIVNETPFVGRDGCIVWNSVPQEVSLCAMFSSELGFLASWSALQAMQQNPPVSIEFDFFRLNAPFNSEKNATPRTKQQQAAAIDKFRRVLNSETIAVLSYIERHCVASSIIEFDHGAKSCVLQDADLCMSLLKLGSIDLLEYLVTEDVYTKFCDGLGQVGPRFHSWTVPKSLASLSNPQLEPSVNCALRLHHMKHEVLPMTTDEDIVVMIDSLSHRVHNEMVCCLLADEGILEKVVSAIRNACKNASRDRDSVATSPQRDDTTITAYLRFLSSLLSLINGVFARELIPHVFSRISKAGILAAIADVCDTYELHLWDPIAFAGTTAKLNAKSSKCTRPLPLSSVADSPSSIGTNYNSPEGRTPGADKVVDSRSPSSSSSVGPITSTAETLPGAIVSEIALFLEETALRLNEKGEESVLGEMFREAILAHPEKYRSFLWFLMRDLRSCPSTNRFLLFHLLGLHDDEGVSIDRNADPHAVTTRNDFHTLFIRDILPEACHEGNVLAALQQPPPPPVHPQTQHSPRPVSRKNSFRSSSNSSQPFKQTRGEGAVTCSTSNNSNAKFTITQPFVRLLEYLLRIATRENRIEMIRIVFSPKSRVLHFLRNVSGKPNEKYSMCANVQFIKSALAHCDQQMTRIFSFEQDVLSPYLSFFDRTKRIPSLFHSVMLSLLHQILLSEELRDLRQYLILRHRALLPNRFCETCDSEALAVLQLRLSGSTEEAALNTVSSISRSRTPMQNARILDTSGSSGKRHKLEVDEVMAPVDARKMETVQSFPLRLRSMIVSISPPLADAEQPKQQAGGTQSPPPNIPKQTRNARTLEDNSFGISAQDTAFAGKPRKPAAPKPPRCGSGGRRRPDPVKHVKSAA